MPKQIVRRDTRRPVHFNADDLPMLIHGGPRAGSSLFTISLIVDLILGGEKVLCLMAFPTARDEFESQLKEARKTEALYDLKEVEGEGLIPQPFVLVKSGEPGLMAEAVRKLPDTKDRIVVISNLDTMLTEELFEAVKNHPKLILSGDVDASPLKDQIAAMSYKTKIIFSQPKIDLGISMKPQEKYVGWMVGKETGPVAAG